MDIFKKNTKLLAYFAVATLLLAAAKVNAATMTYIDTVNPNLDTLIGFGSNKSSYNFTHSIIADQDGSNMFWSGTYGYSPLTDIINASIVLRFLDDNDAASESVHLIFDGQSFGTHPILSGNEVHVVGISNGLGALLNDGILNVTVQNAGTTSSQQDDGSDFSFLDSTLTVDVNEGVQIAQQIPEPASLALIFLGLAGLTFSRRKQA